MELDGRRDEPESDAHTWGFASARETNTQERGDVQRRGLESALRLVERFVDATDGSGARRAAAATTHGPTSAPGLDELTEMIEELAKRSLQTVLEFQRGIAMPPDAGSRLNDDLVVDGGTEPAQHIERVVVRAVRSSSVPASARIWLHNGTTTERCDLRPHCGELREPDGACLVGDVTFEPERIERLPGHSSRMITMHVSGVGQDVVAATYRGIVLVSGLPESWMAVEVLVMP